VIAGWPARGVVELTAAGRADVEAGVDEDGDDGEEGGVFELVTDAGVVVDVVGAGVVVVVAGVVVVVAGVVVDVVHVQPGPGAVTVGVVGSGIVGVGVEGWVIVGGAVEPQPVVHDCDASAAVAA
jgi:hypothetical protein